MGTASESWTTIESDPGVFTELMRSLGVRNAQMHELYDLSSGSLRQLEPVYGLVFLFKHVGGREASEKVVEMASSVHFSRQVVQNACATMALLAILMNQDDSDLDIGESLRQLRDFTADLPPDMRGLATCNADYIRLAHNSFSPPEAQYVDQQSRYATQDDDVFHFISYIHRDGAIWELDGLQPGPIKHKECAKGWLSGFVELSAGTQEEWLDYVGPIIEHNMAQYSSQELHFNLMALVRDRRDDLRARLHELRRTLRSTAAADGACATEREITRVEADLDDAEAQHTRWQRENARRKHNYVPFLFNLLTALAEKGELMPMVNKARDVLDQKQQ